jgi:IS5 family transposase
VRRYVVSDVSVHDSQKFEDVLDASNTASDVWADSAYRSAEIEEKLAECGLKSRIHRRACRNRKLSESQKAANTTRSKVRARVEWRPRPAAEYRNEALKSRNYVINA